MTSSRPGRWGVAKAGLNAWSCNLPALGAGHVEKSRPPALSLWLQLPQGGIAFPDLSLRLWLGRCCLVMSSRAESPSQVWGPSSGCFLSFLRGTCEIQLESFSLEFRVAWAPGWGFLSRPAAWMAPSSVSVSFSPCLFASLSLCVTHTHMNAHTHTCPPEGHIQTPDSGKTLIVNKDKGMEFPSLLVPILVLLPRGTRRCYLQGKSSRDFTESTEVAVGSARCWMPLDMPLCPHPDLPVLTEVKSGPSASASSPPAWAVVGTAVSGGDVAGVP